MSSATAMNNRELQGDQYMGEAEKALKKFTIFGIGAEAKYETAAGCFEKAAAQFKAAKNAKRAAHAYIEAAKNLEKINNELEATTNWKNAATQLAISGDIDEAVQCFSKAIDHYLANDRFNSAAKLQSNIGKLYEDKKIFGKAIMFYNEAIGSFESESNKSQARKVKLQVADILAKSGEYRKAIDLYESIAKDGVDDNLLRWSVKNHLLKASLCQLVLGAQKDDMSEATKAFAKYEEWSEIFCGTRENKLVQDLRKAYEEMNTEAFQDAIFEFDNISKLDEFKTSLLHVVLQELKKEKTPPIFTEDGNKSDQKEDDFR